MCGSTHLYGRPFITSDSRFYATKVSLVNDLDTVTELVERTQTALESEIRPRLEAGDERITELGRAHRRIGVRVDKELVEQVWNRADITDEERQRAVSAAHTNEIWCIGSYAGSSTFVLPNKDRDMQFAHPIA